MNGLSLKALHIIFATSWFSGLFFWIRIMIYHTEALEKRGSADVIQLMTLAASRIQSFVLIPALLGTLGFGTVLVAVTGAYLAPWFHVKLALVLLLVGYHGWAWRLSRRLNNGEVGMSSKRLRLMNELPFFLLVGIVFTAVFRNPSIGVKAIAGLAGAVGTVMVVLRWRRK